MTGRHIHAAVSRIRQDVRQWKPPVLGVVANQTRDPFRVLVACLLSLRTKDATTAAAAARLFALATTPRALGALPARTIERAIYPVCFYRSKARAIRALCAKLQIDFNGAVPDRIEDLVSLPGVGRKTANLVVTLAFGQPGICVDTHVHRITNRWGYVATRTPNETEQALRKTLPQQYWIEFNDLLVPYGQHRCTPTSPFCSGCRLIQWCRRVGVTRSR